VERLPRRGADAGWQRAAARRLAGWHHAQRLKLCCSAQQLFAAERAFRGPCGLGQQLPHRTQAGDLVLGGAGAAGHQQGCKRAELL
jgi:hypothetical protein